jgi:exopolysaccharide biosynthesis protein
LTERGEERMKIIGKKKWVIGLLAITMAISPIVSLTAFGASLGDNLNSKSLVFAENAVLANGVYWNSGVNDKITENYIEYKPGSSVLPIVTYGNDIYGAASFKTVAAMAEADGKHVVAGINGDFFNMKNGVAVGITIKDGILRTSESSVYPSIGFYSDGTAIIGRSDLNIRLDGPTLGNGVGYLHLNKMVTDTSGLILYTRDFGNDDTNKATIPTYNILLDVESGQPVINGKIEAKVDSVIEAVGSTKIPEGKVLLTMSSNTIYASTLSMLKGLVPGDSVTLTFSANEAWNSVCYAIGSGDRLVAGGVNVAPKTPELNPHTAMGIKADGSIIFYTVDGRQSGYSKGTTLLQLANRMLELGCIEAVNLDGGGSTALHSVYPGDSVLTTVNSPSQSSLRNCANYILLLNTAFPTGNLAHIHLYPYDIQMLAGATQKFTVKATDDNFYPVVVPNSFNYSVTNGIGTFDQNGVFTAGTTNGKGDAIYSYNDEMSAISKVSVITKPDCITVLNPSNGQPVTNISVNGGDSIDFMASAIYNKMPLVSQDQCYTWKVQGNIGTIDEKGRFTATKSSNGNGYITASAGGTTAVVNINVINNDLPPMNDPDDNMEQPFIDMNNHWAKESTTVLYNLGIVNGVKTNAGYKYLPDSNMTRSEFAVIVNNWIDADIAKYRNIKLPFVDKDSIPYWATDAIKAMYGMGIIQGVESDGKLYYRPDSSISREEVMTIIGRTQTEDFEEADLTVYTDYDKVSSWALPYVKTLVKQGVVSGYSGKLWPKDFVTRAQAATIIYNLY